MPVRQVEGAPRNAAGIRASGTRGFLRMLLGEGERLDRTASPRPKEDDCQIPAMAENFFTQVRYSTAGPLATDARRNWYPLIYAE